MTDREQELELLARDEGAARVARQVEEATDKGRGAETPAGVELMKQAMEPLIVAINGTIEDAKSGRPGPRARASLWMEQLPADVLAYLTTKAAISAAISSSALTTVANTLAGMIEEELRLNAFEDSQPDLYATVMRRLKERSAGAQHARRVFVYTANKFDVALPTIPSADRVLLGTKLIELLVETTGFITLALVKRGNNRVTHIVRPTDKVNDWLADRNKIAGLMRPAFMPTVELPKPWSGFTGGGYHTAALRKLPLVKYASKPQRAALEDRDMPTVYTALNAIQSTGWRINRRVFELMDHCWKRQLQIAMPTHDPEPLPDKPAGFNAEADRRDHTAWTHVDPKARTAWLSEARRIHELNAETRGKRINIAQVLTAAEELINDPVIAFPHQLDFRGRAYAVPVGLHPQGCDHARALLTFAEGKPITGPRAAGWLMIHGANLYGYDKASFSDRIAWVEERHELILTTDADPFVDMWWTEADKPWCFLAWCMEYAAYLREGDGFVSTLPISVDGSCNGLQHFSAMLRDPIGGAATNLVPSELPSDIYQRVADRVIERLRAMSTSEDFDVQLYAHGWLAFGIDRKLTKRPVMVLPYGGTFRSCMKYVRDAVAEKFAAGKENPFGDQLGKATAYLAKLVWESISDVVVAARTAMDWLQKVARIAAKHGHALTWTTPSGFVAYQAYKDVRRRLVKTKLQGSIVRLSLREQGTQLDPSRQALGISPNFVHSMDASAMMLTIELALNNGVTQFAMIHDSYGTVAADMDMLAACLREAFIDMYESHNVLAEFLAALPEEVQRECPPLPAIGSLDLTAVRDSEFFFA